MDKKKKGIFDNLSSDLPAALVVALVALPLCLGIASGSNAPYFSGIIAGVIGGIVVGAISGSPLSVSGPAAGLTSIVASAIAEVPAFEAFLLSVVIAGFIQLFLGFIKAGVIGDFVPSSVIKGMLAAIGIILIMKQLPHLVGYDADFEGDETFTQPDGQNTLTELLFAFRYISPAAMIIGFVSIGIQLLWDTNIFKANKVLRLIPAALVVVLMGVFINYAFKSWYVELALVEEHLVNIPVSGSITSFVSLFTFPDLAFLSNYNVWVAGVTIAIVASLESLLSLEASDKLDPYKRVSPTNRELIAQGTGNILSGLIGGLPVTAVIVRSSANVMAGAQSKMSAILHGVLLLLCVFFIPDVLNMIPKSALAGVLIFVGYKLAKPTIFKEQYRKGMDQLLPFVVTIVVILFTDLLVGILVGILVGLFFVAYSNFKRAILIVHDEGQYIVRFNKEVSFMNKAFLKRKLEEISDGSYVLIDGTKSNFIDKDIIEVVNNFTQHASLKGIRVEIKMTDYLKKNYFEEINTNNYE